MRHLPHPLGSPVGASRHVAIRAPRLRAGVVLGAALLVALPAGSFARAGSAVTPRAADVGLPAGNGSPAGVSETGSTPSVHYLQAEEHAGDVIDFQPGDRVAVPFTPRSTDRWPVDGAQPRTLPAGRVTGEAMREGRAGNAPDPAGPIRDDAAPAAALPAAATLARAAAGPADASPTTAIAVGPSGLRREVFGFLPYWEVSSSSTVLDWKTLSTVAYFSVGCTSSGNLLKYDPDGTLTTGWGGWTSSRMTSIISAAHQNGTRVVLTLTCFAWSDSGATTQAAVLGSPTARASLARQVAAAVRDRGADGVNLDFEPIVSGYADEYTAFVRSVRTELDALAPGYQLTVDTMGSIGSYEIENLTAAGAADAIFIMGYDYRTAGSSSAGSISPLSGPRYDLADTVAAYAARVPASKLILGVPYYGRAWSTSSDAPNAPNISGTQYGSSTTANYDSVVGIVGTNGRRWDSIEQSPWTAYQKETCTSTYGCVTAWRELYYDDATSLKAKYDLVNRTSLRGAGIWALGFDGSYPELRKALADKFLADTTPPLAGIVNLAPAQTDEGFKVAWTGYDDSTISGYDVQASADGGAWTDWLAGTTATSGMYLGTQGHTYAFRVRGTDSHGNVGAWTAALPVGALAAPASLAAGAFGTVTASSLRMRSSPSTGASIMTTLAAGDVLQVIGEPVSGEGYTWFQVSGPIHQWAPVDPVQVGGWVAAASGTSTYVEPRAPVYATLVAAGIHSLQVAPGDVRVITPDGDGDHDVVHLAWVNAVALDTLTLNVWRSDGTLAGAVPVDATAAGEASTDWDGRLAGALVPAGTYVLQLVGVRGAATYSAPSASPVTPTQIGVTGVLVGPAIPGTLLSFAPTTASPTAAASVSYTLAFAGPVTGLSAADFVRGGTATGCTVGAPSGSGSSYTVSVSGCGGGTLTLALAGGTVRDAVGNPGPASAVAAPAVLIDRTAPVATAPRVALRAGTSLSSSSTSAGLPIAVTWTATDAGGAGIASHDVARSYDGGTFQVIATGVGGTSVTWTVTPGHSYRFEVRARDRAGNVGPWVAASTWYPRLTQQTSSSFAWGGAWSSSTSTSFSGGSVRYAGAAGASARISFTGRAVSFVSTLATTRGRLKVYVDGVYVTTIDLYSGSTRTRTLAWSRSWSSSGTHTLKLVVVGTSGRPRVDVDAIAIIR